MSTRIDQATGPSNLAREDIIDLRHLVSLRDDLRARTLCDHCGEPAHENAESTVVHTETESVHCDPEMTTNAYDTVATLGDPLDVDEVALLAELDRFDREELDGDMERAAENEPTLIHTDYFTDYAQEWAEDIGLIESDRRGGNPLHAFIDWAGWADHLKSDYDEVTLAGETFYHRAD